MMNWQRLHPEADPRAAANMVSYFHELRRIRLELAREPNHPAGSRRHGYIFVAPLDSSGRIDVQAWKRHKSDCRVVRFRPNDEDVGHLVRQPGGGWAFRYDIRGDAPDESGFRFGDERFVIGEYVSIEENNAMRTFRVNSVESV